MSWKYVQNIKTAPNSNLVVRRYWKQKENQMKNDPLIEYCTNLATEFESRRNRIRSFVPKHNLTSGTANEIILRDFLTQLSSKRFGVSQGFLYDPTNDEKASKQCDIIVHDQISYPLVYSDGNVKIIFPNAVKMLVEVKTSLKRPDLKTALENIRAAKRTNQMLNGIIFAFSSPNIKTVVENLESFSEEFSSKTAPIAILLLDKGAIIHDWSYGTNIHGQADTYSVRECESKIVVAFFLLFFFDIQMMGTFGGANIKNKLIKLLKDKTKERNETITLKPTK